MKLKSFICQFLSVWKYINQNLMLIQIFQSGNILLNVAKLMNSRAMLDDTDTC